MLDEITAVNLGLIESAAVTLAPGLTVITGETGAGKTLMLGALRLLRGDKAGKTYIGPAADRCEVAARFVISGEEVVARRSVDSSRSRAYLDDVAVSASGLLDVVGRHVAIIGQHDQLAITSAAGMRDLIDRKLSEDGQAALVAYQNAWLAHKAVRAEVEALGSDPKALERERDMLAYQSEEIRTAALDPEEETGLAAQLSRLRNADALVIEINATLDALGEGGADGFLDETIVRLRAASLLDEELAELCQRAEALAADAASLAGSVVLYTSSMEIDPNELEALEQRKATISALKRKYGDQIPEILEFEVAAAQRAQQLSALLDAAHDLDERQTTTQGELIAAGERLAAERQVSADSVARAAEDHLKDLGFAEPVVRISVEGAVPNAVGADRPILVFASDVALTPAPASAIASGGELSRLVLALTLAAGAHEAALIAFDEVDAGVGGTTALAMGRKLQALASVRQVVCVTHLPQVAAFADAHIAVRRDATTASIESLDDSGRVVELSRMLAGMSDSDKGRDHASELLAMAGKTRQARTVV